MRRLLIVGIIALAAGFIYDALPSWKANLLATACINGDHEACVRSR